MPADARQALKAHAAYSQREAAIWAWMDGVRQRDIGLVFAAFTFSTDASVHLVSTVLRGIKRRLLPVRNITK